VRRGLGPTGRGGRPATALRVRVEDARGRIVRHARVFVDTAGGARPAQARWSPDDGVLMLPRRARPHDLRVLARGFRIQGARGVGADHTIRLKRGYLLRVTVRDAPTDGLPRHLRIMLRVRPILGRGAAPGGVDARTLIDLMDNLGGPGPKGFARGDFGYPVSLAQAQSGILLPLAGRYHVRWGLIDLRTRTWFGLDARCGRDVTIVEGSAPAHAGLTILPEDLQATLAGLTRSEAEAGALADK